MSMTIMNTDQKNLKLNRSKQINLPKQKTYIYDNHEHRPEKHKPEPITLDRPHEKKVYL